jgi:hypothetical protein
MSSYTLQFEFTSVVEREAEMETLFKKVISRKLFKRFSMEKAQSKPALLSPPEEESSESSEDTDYGCNIEELDGEACIMDLVYIALNLPYLPEDKFQSINFNTADKKNMFVK